MVSITEFENLLLDYFNLYLITLLLWMSLWDSKAAQPFHCPCWSRRTRRSWRCCCCCWQTSRRRVGRWSTRRRRSVPSKCCRCCSRTSASENRWLRSGVEPSLTRGSWRPPRGHPARFRNRCSRIKSKERFSLILPFSKKNLVISVRLPVFSNYFSMINLYTGIRTLALLSAKRMWLTVILW